MFCILCIGYHLSQDVAPVDIHFKLLVEEERRTLGEQEILLQIFALSAKKFARKSHIFPTELTLNSIFRDISNETRASCKHAGSAQRPAKNKKCPAAGTVRYPRGLSNAPRLFGLQNHCEPASLLSFFMVGRITRKTVPPQATVRCPKLRIFRFSSSSSVSPAGSPQKS